MFDFVQLFQGIQILCFCLVIVFYALCMFSETVFGTNKTGLKYTYIGGIIAVFFMCLAILFRILENSVII